MFFLLEASINTSHTHVRRQSNGMYKHKYKHTPHFGHTHTHTIPHVHLHVLHPTIYSRSVFSEISIHPSSCVSMVGIIILEMFQTLLRQSLIPLQRSAADNLGIAAQNTLNVDGTSFYGYKQHHVNTPYLMVTSEMSHCSAWFGLNMASSYS